MSGADLNDQTFASFEWQSRWNKSTGPVASVMHVNGYVAATGPMGVVYIRPEDIKFLRQNLKAFDALLAEEEK